jgi:hypothetical protein
LATADEIAQRGRLFPTATRFFHQAGWKASRTHEHSPAADHRGRSGPVFGSLLPRERLPNLQQILDKYFVPEPGEERGRVDSAPVFSKIVAQARAAYFAASAGALAIIQQSLNNRGSVLPPRPGRRGFRTGKENR